MKYHALIPVLLFQACALNTSGLGTIGEDTIPPDDTPDFSAEVDVAGDSEDVLVDVPDPDIPIDLPVDLPPDEIIPDNPVDASCMPNAAWCSGPETLETCNADGMDTAIETCRYYCLDGPPAHCAQPVPSNVNDASLYCVAGTGGFNPLPSTDHVIIDVDTGSMTCFNSARDNIGSMRGEGEGVDNGIHYTRVTQPGGAPSLGVFSFDSFALPGHISLYGYGGHALVILSCHDVIIDGTINAGANAYSDGYGNTLYEPGPGGSSSGGGLGAGGQGGDASSDYSGGGGGGSFGAIGGNGNSSVAGMAGGVYGDEALVPLHGGSGGGKGADDSGYSGGSGGAGGGALEISTPASITVNGRITAAGFYGFGAGPASAGGGGGSGGGIMLEAHTISIMDAARIAANGGGGGGGSYWLGYAVSNNGEKGHADIIPAAGGSVSAGNYGCRGGNGNSSEIVNGETSYCGTNEWNGGGGGGGAGRIRINSKIDSILGNPLSPSPAAPVTTTTLGSPLTH